MLERTLRGCTDTEVAGNSTWTDFWTTLVSFKFCSLVWWRTMTRTSALCSGSAGNSREHQRAQTMASSGWQTKQLLVVGDLKEKGSVLPCSVLAARSHLWRLNLFSALSLDNDQFRTTNTCEQAGECPHPEIVQNESSYVHTHVCAHLHKSIRYASVCEQRYSKTSMANGIKRLWFWGKKKDTVIMYCTASMKFFEFPLLFPCYPLYKYL